MSDTYERLKSLWETDGRAIQEGSPEDGAAYAFAAALGVMKHRLDAAFAALLPDDTSDYTALAGLLGLVSERFAPEELAEEVKNRMAHSFGDYTVTALMHAFDTVGSGTFSADRDAITFSGTAEEDLGELGKFIAAFLLPWNTVIYDGDGMTFDEWESMQLTFYGYDSLLLPFAVLDSYRRTE